MSPSQLVCRWGLVTVTMLVTAFSGFAQSPAATAKVATRTGLSVSTIEGAHRTQATFTVDVEFASDEAQASKPAGSVSFMNGERSVGSAFLDADGRATYTVDALAAGEQKIVAVYGGDESHQASSSVPAAVDSATSGVPGFTLSATPTSLSVAAGATGLVQVATTPENGFNQAVSLSCSGVPYATVTCVFTPPQVTPSAPTIAAPAGTAALSTLSIQTTAASGALRPAPLGPADGGTAYAIALPGMLTLAGLGLLGRRRFFAKYGHSAKLVGLLFLLLAGSMGLGACAQRYKYYHRPPAGNPGTPTGAYIVTISGITGTGSSLSTASVQVALTVTGD